MGNVGSWKSPLPLRLGGGGHRLVEGFYKGMRAARPEALRGDPGTEVDIENRMAARMLAQSWRSTERRVLQRDPLKLSIDQRPVASPVTGALSNLSMMQRWEAILGVTPGPDASETDRRRAIAGRIAGSTSARLQSITAAMQTVLGSWFVGIVVNRVSDVDYPGRVPAGSVQASWPTPQLGFSSDSPGSFNPTYPWSSGLAKITVTYTPPVSADPLVVKRLREQVALVLDDILPAWMAFSLSQLAVGTTSAGFHLGVSPLGLTAL